MLHLILFDIRDARNISSFCSCADHSDLSKVIELYSSANRSERGGDGVIDGGGMWLSAHSGVCVSKCRCLSQYVPEHGAPTW